MSSVACVSAEMLMVLMPSTCMKVVGMVACAVIVSVRFTSSGTICSGWTVASMKPSGKFATKKSLMSVSRFGLE